MILFKQDITIQEHIDFLMFFAINKKKPYIPMDKSKGFTARLGKTDIRYMWLSNEERPSHMAFQRLTKDLIFSIDDIFFILTNH